MRRRFLKLSIYFHYFITISPWKRAWPFIWTNMISITQRCFVSSLVEIDPVVLKKQIFKVCQCIFVISLLSPLGKGCCLSFAEIWIPITQGCFVASFVEIGPVVLKKKMKMWKVYRQTDRQMDDRQQVIRKAHLSYQLRWAKKEEKRSSNPALYLIYISQSLFCTITSLNHWSSIHFQNPLHSFF